MVETVVVRKGRIIAITELFKERCNAFLCWLKHKERVNESSIFFDDEWDVVNYLLMIGKIKESEDRNYNVHFSAVNSPLLPVESIKSSFIDPTVLSLLEENPANAEAVRIYKVNR